LYCAFIVLSKSGTYQRTTSIKEAALKRGHTMFRIVVILLLLTPGLATADNFSKLYEDETKISYDDLVVDIKGYKVPTRTSFRAWIMLNHADKRVQAIADDFKANGITVTMPLYLILLQGTDWAMNNTSLFTLPDKKNTPNMIKTIKFIQTYIEPEIGIVIPVSGERSDIYNSTAGGASKSKHLSFCALDMVPKEDITREALHKKLKAIHKEHGKKNNVGLGLYSGVRFHIDTCGFRNW